MIFANSAKPAELRDHPPVGKVVIPDHGSPTFCSQASVVPSLSSRAARARGSLEAGARLVVAWKLESVARTKWSGPRGRWCLGVRAAMPSKLVAGEPSWSSARLPRGSAAPPRRPAPPLLPRRWRRVAAQRRLAPTAADMCLTGGLLLVDDAVGRLPLRRDSARARSGRQPLWKPGEQCRHGAITNRIGQEGATVGTASPSRPASGSMRRQHGPGNPHVALSPSGFQGPRPGGPPRPRCGASRVSCLAQDVSLNLPTRVLQQAH